MSRPNVLPDLAPPTVHRVPAQLLQRTVRVAVIGCGGTGSEIASGLPFLHQAMLAHGHPGGLEVTLIDGDVVSPTNIVRQAFGASDIGHPKAIILASRINAFYGLQWRALPRHLRASDVLDADLVIGCVDTRRARAIIRDSAVRQARRERLTYWLDLGNGAASGQFILGQPCYETRSFDSADVDLARSMRARKPRLVTELAPYRLPTVAELYPETVDVKADGKDDAPSCSAVEALARQEPFVNRAIAAQALAMLARLFRYGELAYHGGYVNLVTGRTTCLPVSIDAWNRVRGIVPQRRRPRVGMTARRAA